jgi:hypothetical protein
MKAIPNGSLLIASLKSLTFFVDLNGLQLKLQRAQIDRQALHTDSLMYFFVGRWQTSSADISGRRDPLVPSQHEENGYYLLSLCTVEMKSQMPISISLINEMRLTKY